MTKNEELKLALEALDIVKIHFTQNRHVNEAITAIKQALAAPVQPVATLWQNGRTGRTRITMPGDITDCDADWFKASDLYTSPPAQRKPLTLGQKQRLWSSVGDKPTLKDRVNAYGLAIEAAHHIKENT
jgi:hypothetical protein